MKQDGISRDARKLMGSVQQEELSLIWRMRAATEIPVGLSVVAETALVDRHS